MTDIINKDEIVQKLTEKLGIFLQEQLGEQAFNDYLVTLLPAVVSLAVAEGILAAETVVIGLTSGNTQPYWDALIRAASPADRIPIMETTRQAAIQDTLNIIKRKEQSWTVFKTSLGLFLSLLFALL